MKNCLSILSLVGCAVLAAPAVAQTAPAPSAAAAPAREPAPTRTAGVDLKGTAPAAARDLQRVTAAGSVIVLADGIVANARMAQVQPPAPGFVYER